MLRPVTRVVVSSALAGALLLGGCTVEPGPPTESASTVTAQPDRLNETFSGATGRVRYHLFPAAQPRGLVVQFHGDGAFEWDNPTSSYSLGGPNGIVAAARQRGFTTVAVRTPDTTGTWWRNGTANVPAAYELISTLQKETGTSEVWLVGYSGGSQFITKFLLPAHPELMASGGAIMFGGGGPPSASPAASRTTGAGTASRTTGPSAAPRLTGSDAYRMHWYTGALDTGADDEGYNAREDAGRGERWYAARGVRTSHEWPEGTRHDLDGLFGRVVADQLPER